LIEKFKLKNDKTEIKLNISNKVFYPTETTKYLLESSVKIIKKKKQIEILDLGCGNGVIGIFLLKKFKQIKRLTFSDISINAIKLTKINLKLNRISPKKYVIIKSDQFQNLSDKKFDIIINDVSGISSKIAEITNWFKNVPCNSGSDGTKLTQSILKKFPYYLKKSGLFIFPIISFSNEKKIIKLIQKLKLKSDLLSINQWPVPKILYKNLNKIKKLKKDKLIDFEIKYNLIIANTKILQLKTKNKKLI
jgi:methylase of polypeptide subunit release factors